VILLALCAELRLLVKLIISVKDVDLADLGISFIVLDVKLDCLLLRTGSLHNAVANKGDDEEAEQSDYGNQEDMSASSEITRFFLFYVDFLFNSHIAWSLVSWRSFSILILVRRTILRTCLIAIRFIGL